LAIRDCQAFSGQNFGQAGERLENRCSESLTLIAKLTLFFVIAAYRAAVRKYGAMHHTRGHLWKALCQPIGF
jgi:hypothetical protein